MLHDGYFDKVYYRFWESEAKTHSVANIFAIHGLGGHCLWFDEAAKKFNIQNINFFSFDLPGFGQSKYPKGTISSYKDWISVTREVLENFLVHFEINSPVFILGHSMGALIAILLSKNVRTNGWIFSVPGFEGDSQLFPVKTFVLPVLFKGVCMPSESITVPFGPELLTRNKGTQLKVKKDSLRVINLNAKVFLNVYLLSLLAKHKSDSLSPSVLMLEAGEDKICSRSAMEKFFNGLKLQDKCKKIYPNSFHDLFIEDELEEIVFDISEWIKKRI